MGSKAEDELNPAPDFSVRQIGREREPLMVIDGVMRRPEALVDFAASLDFGTELEMGLYPGVRAPAPLDYVEAIARRFSPAIVDAFGLGGVRLARAECSFSIVTAAPSALVPMQRIPHVDTSYPLQFALLHYLCGERFGGTAFYRQNATGFETIGVGREPAYEAARAEDLAALANAPAAYVAASSPRYEQIAAIPVHFDRMLVYRSCLLHSGQIRPSDPLCADPRRGRLTANIFLSYRAA